MADTIAVRLALLPIGHFASTFIARSLAAESNRGRWSRGLRLQSNDFAR
jgi:hypothetical protein